MDAVDKIAVLDFGGQYTQLIARRIRDLGVYSEIFPCTNPPKNLLTGYKGIVLSGGPNSVYDTDAPLPAKALFEAGVPVLGICYGMQAMGYLLGGDVVPSDRREYGKASVHLTGASRLLEGVKPEDAGRVTVWMSHGDSVLKPPPGFTALGATTNCPVAAMADEARKLYAVQFHPEVVHTPQGRRVFENFLDICGTSRTWSMASFVDDTVAAIRAKVGGDRVLCGLSGGVDSSVVAVLLHQAIGDQLTCVFVDNGLLRKGEAEAVVRTFRDTFKINLIHVDASTRFLEALTGVTDPEVKRKRVAPTSSSRSPTRGPRRPSRRITTWAGCRRTCSSAWWSRSASSSRTRSGAWASCSASPRRSCGASRSRGRVSRSACSAR